MPFNFINHLVLFNNVLIALLAEQEGGKSTFIHLLTKVLETGIKPFVIRVKDPYLKDALMNGLVQTLHLRQDKTPDLNNIIEQINERKTHVLVIIDDAHYISDAFLNELMQGLMTQGNAGYFHVCLVADFSLAASLKPLQTEELKHRIHRIELGSLTESEMKTYLLRYLPAGKTLEKSMSVKRLQAFHEATAGNIARINHDMVKYFVTEPAKLEIRRQKLLKRVSLSLAASFMAASAGYLFMSNHLVLQAPMPEVAVTKTVNQPPLVQLDPSLIEPIRVAALNNHKPKHPKSITVVEHQEPLLTSHIPAYFLAALSQPVFRASIIQPINLDLARVEQIHRKVTVNHKPTTATKSLSFIPPAPRFAAKSSPVDAVAKAKQPDNQMRFTVQLMASLNLEDLTRFVKKTSIK